MVVVQVESDGSVAGGFMKSKQHRIFQLGGYTSVVLLDMRSARTMNWQTGAEHPFLSVI